MTKNEIGIGTRVSYEDMANPLREGAIVGEVAGQWAVKWDDGDVGRLVDHEGTRSVFHTTVTKSMLEAAYERNVEAKHKGNGRIAGWNAILRPCALCGSEVTSPNPEVDFCRLCHYSGAALERSLRTDERDVLARLGALEGVEDATVWHTGGGCFNLAITLTDGRLLTPSMAVESGADISPEPGIPDIDDGERWCLVISESREAWEEWDEDRIDIPHYVLDDDDLVAAVDATIKRQEWTIKGGEVTV